MGEPSDLRAGPCSILASEALTESRSNVKSFPIVTCLAVPALAPTAPVTLADRDQYMAAVIFKLDRS